MHKKRKESKNRNKNTRKKKHNNTDKQTNEQNNFLKRTTFLISVLDLGLVCPILERQTDIPRLAYSPMHHPRSPKYQGGKGEGNFFGLILYHLLSVGVFKTLSLKGRKLFLLAKVQIQRSLKVTKIQEKIKQLNECKIKNRWREKRGTNGRINGMLSVRVS